MIDYNINALIDSVLRCKGYAYFRKRDMVYLYDYKGEFLFSVKFLTWTKFRTEFEHKKFSVLEVPRGYMLTYEY